MQEEVAGNVWAHAAMERFFSSVKTERTTALHVGPSQSEWCQK